MSMTSPSPTRRVLLALLPFAGIIAIVVGGYLANLFYTDGWAESPEEPPSPVVTPEPLGTNTAPAPDSAPTEIKDDPTTPSTIQLAPSPIANLAEPLAAPEEAELVPIAPVTTSEKSPEEAFLDRVEHQYEEISSIRAEITQTKYSDLFLDEVKADAELLVKKPGKLRIFYRQPADWDGSTDDSRHWLFDENYWFYIPVNNQVEKYPIGQTDSSVERINLELLSFDLEAAEVFRAYDVKKIAEAPVADGETSMTLKLTPLQDENIHHLYLSFVEKNQPLAVAIEGDQEQVETSDEPVEAPLAEDQTTLLIQHVFYEEKSGDTTDILFRSIEINPTLVDALFVPEYPEDATIIEH